MLIVVFGTSVMAFPSVIPQALKQFSGSCCAESDTLGQKGQSAAQRVCSLVTQSRLPRKYYYTNQNGARFFYSCSSCQLVMIHFCWLKGLHSGHCWADREVPNVLHHRDIVPKIPISIKMLWQVRILSLLMLQLTVFLGTAKINLDHTVLRTHEAHLSLAACF